MTQTETDRIASQIAAGRSNREMAEATVGSLGGMLRYTARSCTDQELAKVLVTRGWSWADVLRQNS